MILDPNDKPWIAAIIAIMVLATAFYIPYARATVRVSGGSWTGLAYGISGTALMVFAGLLGARKKFPTLRVGRVHLWMRGHVWLGLLSFPLILFHGGFALGGTLTMVMMILFAIILLSGILGVILQQFIPKIMLRTVSNEIVVERADEFASELLQKAEARVESLKPKATDHVVDNGYEVVRSFYDKDVSPFLHNPKHTGLLLMEQRTRLVFEHVRKLVPPSSHKVVDDLQVIVQQRRDLLLQIRLQRILQGWLLVHVPLSAALLILTVVHVIVALRYG